MLRSSGGQVNVANGQHAGAFQDRMRLRPRTVDYPRARGRAASRPPSSRRDEPTDERGAGGAPDEPGVVGGAGRGSAASTDRAASSASAPGRPAASESPTDASGRVLRRPCRCCGLLDGVDDLEVSGDLSLKRSSPANDLREQVRRDGAASRRVVQLRPGLGARRGLQLPPAPAPPRRTAAHADAPVGRRRPPPRVRSASWAPNFKNSRTSRQKAVRS